MYYPLFLPLLDLDTARAYPRKSLMLQTQVTDLLEAEVLGDAGFGGFKRWLLLLLLRHHAQLTSCSCGNILVVVTKPIKNSVCDTVQDDDPRRGKKSILSPSFWYRY